MENEIKDMLGLILTKLDGIELRIDGSDSKIDRLESKIDRLESRQDEIYLVVKAIEHNNQVHRAEINNLQYKVDYVEGTLNALGDVIITRKAIK